MKLLVATRSGDKLREIRAILGEVPGVEVTDLEEVGVAHSEEEERIERYDTFEENARAKARYFRSLTGLPTVADDSGLAVDALGGKPGVRSKRFAPGGEGRDGKARDEANNEHLLALLRDVPREDRTARYVCVVALDRGEEEWKTFRGEAEGVILEEPRGEGGFGYDPLFLDPELGRTFAEVAPGVKHARSHRGRAFRALSRFLRDGALGESG